jgi:rubrerythrin
LEHVYLSPNSNEGGTWRCPQCGFLAFGTRCNRCGRIRI